MYIHHRYRLVRMLDLIHHYHLFYLLFVINLNNSITTSVHQLGCVGMVRILLNDRHVSQLVVLNTFLYLPSSYILSLALPPYPSYNILVSHPS
jgi:hypothetical protein